MNNQHHLVVWGKQGNAKNEFFNVGSQKKAKLSILLLLISIFQIIIIIIWSIQCKSWFNHRLNDQLLPCFHYAHCLFLSFFPYFFSDTHDVLHALTFNIILQSYSGPSMACSSTHVPFHFKIQTIPYYIMFFSIEFNHSPYLPSMPPSHHHILLPSHSILFSSTLPHTTLSHSI